MSAQNVNTPRIPAGPVGRGKIAATWRWLTVAVALAILLQAALASFGLFEGEAQLVDIHRGLGNSLPLVALAQAILATILFRRGGLGKAELWIGIVLVPVVMGQLSLGYETDGSSTAIAMHISLGVLLMSLATVNAMLAWIPRVRA